MTKPSSMVPVGTCVSMCSPSEVSFRDRNGLIHPLESIEMSADPKSLVPDPAKMVKEYTRSAAGREEAPSSSLRPPPVLRETISYLLAVYSKFRMTRFDLMYSFVSDRLRAVRQDMIIQCLSPSDVVDLLQRMIPFYVETDYSCKINNCRLYNWKLHSTQLHECFSRWWDAIPYVSTVSSDVLASYLLRNAVNDNFALRDYFLQKHRLPGDYLRNVMQLIRSSRSGDFVLFFRSVSSLPEGFVRMSLVDNFSSVRLRALNTIALGYKSPPAKIPVNTISRWLAFDSDDLTKIISHYHILKDASHITISSLSSDLTETLTASAHSNLLFKCDSLLC